MLLLPLKVDVPTSRIPFANYLLIAGIATVSILAFYDFDAYLYLGGIQIVDHGDKVTARLISGDNDKALAALTSLFVHGGWIHLLGNLWFLWVFGNAVNYKLGQVAYLVLFVFCGWIGSLTHYVFTGVPVVGASGAINGIVGAFLVFFPRNDTSMLLWVVIYARRFTLSSYWIIIFWFVWDVGSLVIGAGKGVALWSHIAGFSVGFAIAWTCAKRGIIKSTPDEQNLLEILSPGKKAPRRYY